jgi:hypothetical protein
MILGLAGYPTVTFTAMVGRLKTVAPAAKVTPVVVFELRPTLAIIVIFS